MTTYDEKLERGLAELEAKGVSRGRAWPAAQRLLARLGAHPRPPLYQGFGHIAVLHGSLFMVLLALMNVISGWGKMAVSQGITLAVAGGVIYGLLMAWVLRRKAKSLGLGRWKDL